MNIDEFIAQLEKDETGDQKYMKPVQYAKLRGLYPQQIYGWMKNGTLTSMHCDCGSRVIEVEEADELLRSKGKLSPRSEDEDPGDEDPDDEDPDDEEDNCKAVKLVPVDEEDGH
jgi:hypothetical protein